MQQRRSLLPNYVGSSRSLSIPPVRLFLLLFIQLIPSTGDSGSTIYALAAGYGRIHIALGAVSHVAPGKLRAAIIFIR